MFTFLDEVWAHIFQLVGKNFNEPLDISVTFELRVICKQWNNLILTFEKATILKPNSINRFLSISTSFIH